ncbi:LysE family translocator [Luteimonas sp. M1R5S18]|uniref:LysE family translocator n=1 Tax=Luteimonas rhizosphaericola TaxID=3042024 RepID=A0ABT6JF08_9GAMM|nr:LysE family translocator [Luteimonas rhizosphaericola]MDH5829050.1 LysE family translocator [Luteimonas rhizosphaericola]
MMSLLVSMCLFSLALSISPGPVNMVIVSSGANHGFRRTIPYVSGATIGFTLLLIFVSFGLLHLVVRHPIFMKSLAVLGSAFIVYIGYRIASARPQLAAGQKSAPTFMQGFTLQWLNPKAWMACASGAALFSNPETTTPLLVFAVVYFLVCYISLAAWALLGDRAAMYLNSESRMRLFNLSMGGLLIATAIYLVHVQVFQSMD